MTAMASYAALARPPQGGAALVPGTLQFEGWRMRFQSESFVFDIPLVRLGIEFDGEQVVFTDADHAEVWVGTNDQGILDAKPLRQQAHTRNQIDAFRSYPELKRRLKLVLWATGICVAVGLLGYLCVGLMVRALVMSIPAQWEQEVGDEVFEELREKMVVVEGHKARPELARAMAPLVAVVPSNGIGFKFHISENQLPNAFALPGGHVIVTTGMLDFAEKPDELAGVVAHELAHVAKKHGFRKVLADAGPYLIFRMFFGDSQGLLGVFTEGSHLLVAHSFSQEYELEADAVGCEYLSRAGIDSTGYLDILRRINTYQTSTMGLSSGAFSSHPSTEKRLRLLEAKLRRAKKVR